MEKTTIKTSELKRKKFKLQKPNIPENKDVINILGEPEKKIFENNIKIAIWNSYKSKKKGFFQDLEHIISRNDLTLLQEYYPNKIFFKNILIKDREFVSATSFISRKEIPTGVCTISKVKSISSKYFRSEAREPLISTPKMILITEYKTLSSSLCIINVHGINFVKTKNFEKQMTQVENYLKSHDGPIILGGDFNIWNKKRNSIVQKITSENGFTETNFQNDIRKIKLDRVFTKNVKIISANILNDFKSSDHSPLELEIDL